MGTPKTSREPCPDRIIDDFGIAFSMGAVSGSVLHFCRGFYRSPIRQRFRGGIEAVRMNAPGVAGHFAAWGGVFSVFDCMTVYARQKEDPWNSIISGSLTGGFLSMRKGLRPASKSVVLGGLVLSMIQGAEFMFDKYVTEMMSVIDRRKEEEIKPKEKSHGVKETW